MVTSDLIDGAIVVDHILGYMPKMEEDEKSERKLIHYLRLVIPKMLQATLRAEEAPASYPA